MRNSRNIAVGFSLLLTEVVILSCCLYMLVCFGLLGTIRVCPYLWLGLIVVSYFINMLLAKKEAAISLFVVWNVIWMVISFGVVWVNFACSPDILLLRILAALVIVAVEAHSCNISLEPPKVQQCVLFIDALAIVFIIFLAGSRYRTPGDITGIAVLGFVNLIYLVIVIILLRTSNGTRRVIEGNAAKGRGKMFGLLIGLLVICTFVCVVLFGAMRQTAFGLRDLMLNLLQGLRDSLYLLERLLSMLFELLGISAKEGTFGKRLGYGLSPAPIWEGFQKTLLSLILCAVAAVIVCIVAATVHHKLRKKPIRSKSVIISRKRCKQVRIPFLRKWLEKISLYLLMRRNRKTPEGLLLLAKKRAKMVGVTMEAEDSWHGFILKLVPYGEEDTLKELAEYIKRYFYREVPMEFTKEQYLKYKKCLRVLTKEKNKRDVPPRFHV